MSLFRKKSLVASIDELLDLVENWNLTYAAPTASATKEGSPFTLSSAVSGRKRPSSSTASSDDLLPLKKTKLNATPRRSVDGLNNEWSLERKARDKCEILIRNALAKVYSDVTFDSEEFKKMVSDKFTRPRPGKGEVAVPCFMLAKKLKKKPPQIAEELAAAISDAIERQSADSSSVFSFTNPIENVEAFNGYVNVRLTSEYLGQVVPRVLDSGNSLLAPLQSADGGSAERVMVEYSQPNTHKAFHVGHMRNVALGDSLVRLFKHRGADVIAANYFGDEGAHVAACIWRLQKLVAEKSLDLDNPQSFTGGQNLGEWLGDAYVDSKRMLDLSTFSKVAIKGAVVAKVLSKEKHPSASKAAAKWNVVSVDIGQSEAVTVVCGGSHYEVGDFVPYLPVGSRYKKNDVVSTDKEGVVSNGVILGAAECGAKLPPLPEAAEVEEKKEEVLEESSGKGKKGKGKKKGKKASKKKKKKKKQTADHRILVLNGYATEERLLKAGELVSEVSRDWEATRAAAIADDTSVETAVAQFETEVREVLKKLEALEPETTALWRKTRQWSLDEFKKIYAWIEAGFDHDFTESQVSESSRDVVMQYLDKGVFEYSEGAIGCNLESESLPFCLLIKSDGSGLYAAKDLALAAKKFDEFHIDTNIYVVGAEQSHHFKQVFATLRRMGYPQAAHCYHVSYGLVVLPTGKMAARKGTAILFSKLQKLLSDEVNEQFLEGLRKQGDWSEEELREAERKISVGTIRYGMLNHDTAKDIVFELSKWALSSGNTGPYLQYQCARINSIAKKVKAPKGVDPDFALLSADDERALLFLMSQFQDKIKQVVDARNPSPLCDYTYAVAQQFSSWYNKPQNSILKCEAPVRKATMLAFAHCVAQVMRKCLYLLGVPVLDRM